jgi:putative ABC transport system permease protein
VLLLIACTNIASLMLSRSTRRHGEIAVRYALGASRPAIVMHLLTEAALLAVAGAAAGLVLASGASGAFRILAPSVPRLETASMDARLLMYTTASAVVVAILCGLLPAFRGTRSAGTLMHSSRTQVSQRRPVQWLLVGVQVALSVTLLASAGLLVRSLGALSRVDPGFDAARVLAFRISAAFGEERDYTRTIVRVNRTIDELAALPGVQAVATTTLVPGVPATFTGEFDLVERRASGGQPLPAELRAVSPEYFRTLRIPLLEGELCRRPVDAAGVTQVMVNRGFADRYARAGSIVGLHLTGATPSRIMGIVGNVREMGIDREPVPTVYQCFSAPTPFPVFLVRTTGEPSTVAGAVRRRVNQLEPLRSVYDVESLEASIDGAYAQNRMRTTVLGLFAVAALSLACLGVYGTLSYLIAQRRREVGLKLALGAARGAIVREFIGQAIRLAAVAGACGLLLALAFAQLLSGMLYEVSPYDPATLAAVCGIVMLVAVLAALVPAGRAALIEPMRILREEQ